MSMSNYHSKLLPQAHEYYKMNKVQARDSFNRFKDQIPHHIEYLKSQCAKELKLEPTTLDFSEKTLLIIWKWFISKAEVRSYTKTEMEEMEAQFGHLGPTMVGNCKLTESTELMVQDIGLFLAEVFLANFSEIKWDYVQKPKSDFFINHPVLTGFVDTNYTPPFHPVFQPIHMVGVQAVKIIEGTANQNDLLTLYQKWATYS